MYAAVPVVPTLSPTTTTTTTEKEEEETPGGNPANEPQSLSKERHSATTAAVTEAAGLAAGSEWCRDAACVGVSGARWACLQGFGQGPRSGTPRGSLVFFWGDSASCVVAPALPGLGWVGTEVHGVGCYLGDWVLGGFVSWTAGVGSSFYSIL